MSQITVKRRGWWGSIPESLLTDQRLGHAAVRLGAWLAMRQDGWKVRKQHARAVLGLGETSWDRACSELKVAGYLYVVPLRTGGKFSGQDYIFDPVPSANPPEAVLPPPVITVGGSTRAGEKACLTSTDLTGTNITNTTTNTNAEILSWPPGLAKGQQAACLAAMVGVSFEQQQMLLDELSGQNKPVPNPVGWLRRLAMLASSGAFQAGFADQVKEARTRATSQVKEAAKVAVRPPTVEERAKFAALLGRQSSAAVLSR